MKINKDFDLKDVRATLQLFVVQQVQHVFFYFGKFSQEQLP
jgi:hypothetical protein